MCAWRTKKKGSNVEMRKITKLLVMFMAAVMMLAMAGCGGSDKKEEKKAEQPKAKNLVVAVAATPKPYNYLDKDGKLTGYEIDMINELAKRTGYTVKYEVTEFPSLFAGLDAGRYNVIAGNISKKPERVEKYLFSTKPYFKNKIVLVVKEGNTKVNSIKDIGGLKIPAGSGRANALFMEKYNKLHADKPVSIQYTDADASEALIALHNGRYDACIYNQTYVTNVAKEYGHKFKVIDIPNADEIEIPEAWLLFKKGDTKLQGEFDKALDSMKADGSLGKMSVKYFGNDYVPKK